MRAHALVATLTAASLLAAPLTARAQSVPPQASPPPPSAVAPNGEFVAPLAQTTQPTYVPQSVAMSGPRVIKDWDEGQPVPDGYHTETRARTGLIIGGAIPFGIFYLFSALAAAISTDASRASGGENKDGVLFIPVVGPFIRTIGNDSTTGNFFLVIDGVVQGAGAAMLIAGIASPKTVLVRNDLATIRISPMSVGQRGTGIGLIGSF